MPVISAERLIVRHLIRNFGIGDASARDVTSDFGFSLDLVQVPGPEFTSYGTVGLCRAPLRAGKRDFPIRLELVAAAPPADGRVAEALCATAFEIARRRMLACPGVVFRDRLSGAEAPHVYLSDPKAWGDRKFGSVAHKAIEVHFLQAIPVTSEEADFAEQRGFAEFEKLLAGSLAHVAGPDRLSLLPKARAATRSGGV